MIFEQLTEEIPESGAIILQAVADRAQQLFAERIANSITVDENGCWLWNRFTDRNGYGRASVCGKYILAHRLMFNLLVGPIPEDRPEIDHLCRVRNCCNPDHLEPVTREENMRRVAAANTCCRRGHSYADHAFVNSKGDRECRICSQRVKSESQRRLRDTGVGPRASWTECIRGHELSGSNLIVNKSGSRECRLCKNERQRLRRRRSAKS